jgi:hypothetical protein
VFKSALLETCNPSVAWTARALNCTTLFGADQFVVFYLGLPESLASAVWRSPVRVVGEIFSSELIILHNFCTNPRFPPCLRNDQCGQLDACCGAFCVRFGYIWYVSIIIRDGEVFWTALCFIEWCRAASSTECIFLQNIQSVFLHRQVGYNS